MFGFVVDCETVAIPEAGSLMEPVTPPSNYVEEEAKARYIAKHTALQVEKAALDVHKARIICLGWLPTNEEEPRQVVCNSDASERSALALFWAHVTDKTQPGNISRLITFNGHKYDLPLLMVRSMVLGVPNYPILNLSRYRSPHFDVAQVLSLDGKLDYHTQRWYAQRYGLPMDDAFGGKEIAQLYEDQNWDAIKAHNAWDLRTTKALYQRVSRWVNVF